MDIQTISLYFHLCASVLIKCFACEVILLFLCAAGWKYGKGREEMKFEGIFNCISVFREWMNVEWIRDWLIFEEECGVPEYEAMASGVVFTLRLDS
jgi:hypothetical protein